MNYGYSQEKEEDVLIKYGRDITKAAKENKIDPVIGRDLQVNRLIEIKNHKKLIEMITKK